MMIKETADRRKGDRNVRSPEKRRKGDRRRIGKEANAEIQCG